MILLKTLALKTIWALKRSWKWPALYRKTLKATRCCAACGGTTKLRVHHIRPFHLFPMLELVPSNLIVLCEAKGKQCHLRVGHGRDWDLWNPNVVGDAAMMRANPALQALVWIHARDAAIKNQSASGEAQAAGKQMA